MKIDQKLIKNFFLADNSYLKLKCICYFIMKLEAIQILY